MSTPVPSGPTRDAYRPATAAPAVGSDRRPVLRPGASGPHVTALQERLEAHGFDLGEVDGRFGPKTKAALEAFQRARRLKPDGIVGPKSWRALEAEPKRPEPASAELRLTGPLMGTTEKEGHRLPHTSGRATTFWNGAYEYKGMSDPINNSLGAWGDQNRPTDYMCAIPVGLHGGGKWWHNQKLLVTDRDTGKQVVVVVQDKGPGPRTGAVIDLSPVAKEALGHHFLNDARVNIAFAPDDAPLGPVK